MRRSTPQTESQRHYWLILAHCFNMDGRAASQTITDRIPFLLEKGIIPIVISAPTGDKDQRFPHYQIFSPAPSGFLFEMRHIIKKHFPTSPVVQRILKVILTLLLLPFYLLEKIVIYLDSHWSWCISATIKSLLIIHKYHPTVIYSTAGPSSTHVAGYLVNKLSKLPWMCELHDPLIGNHVTNETQRSKFQRWIEKIVSHNADSVIFFTEAALAQASSRHPVLQSKSCVIRPGANPPDFSSQTYRKKNRIHFGHFGSLATDRNISVLVKAIHRIIQDNPSWADYISLDIYGSELDQVSKDCLAKYPLPGIITVHGRLEYDPLTAKTGRLRVMEAMQGMDVLVAVHGEGGMTTGYIPSKIYEYLLTKRPILCLTDGHSELSHLLKDQKGCICAPQDPDEAKTIVIHFIEQWLKEGLPDTTHSPFTVTAAVNQILHLAQDIAGR